MSAPVPVGEFDKGKPSSPSLMGDVQPARRGRHVPGVVSRKEGLKARSNNRLIASDRDGFGSGWRSIQASSLAFSSAGMRRPV
jgi:hypothetical protein